MTDIDSESRFSVFPPGPPPSYDADSQSPTEPPSSLPLLHPTTSQNVSNASSNDNLTADFPDVSGTSGASSSAPVVLTWEPELYDPYFAHQGPSSVSRIPFGNPPGYVASRAPTRPIVYTFSPLSFNSMILLPPPHAPDTRPVYHISVSMNCFIPSSYITTVRRGASENGELVGEFEMGISDSPATLYIRKKEFMLNQILRKHGPRSSCSWDWGFVKFALHWDYTKTPHICSNKTRDIVYAKFKPTTKLREPGVPTDLVKLEVTPAGQEFFDDIIISVLIIERWRLSPAIGTHKVLFNL